MSKNNNNKGDGGGEKKTASVTVVLKVNMHCDSCASKIAKTVRAFQGVKTVKAESETGKVTVTGEVDPAKLREQLELKSNKKVELVSPQPDKEKETYNNKDSKDKNTSNEDKNKDNKKPKEALLKMDFHSDRCIEKIQKTVSKTKGVNAQSIDKEKQLVTVKGTMNVRKLAERLAEKLKRNVEIVQPGKKEKEKETANIGSEGVNMMEYVAAQPAHGSAYEPNEDGNLILKAFSDDNPNACVVI